VTARYPAKRLIVPAISGGYRDIAIVGPCLPFPQGAIHVKCPSYLVLGKFTCLSDSSDRSPALRQANRPCTLKRCRNTITMIREKQMNFSWRIHLYANF